MLDHLQQEDQCVVSTWKNDDHKLLEWMQALMQAKESVSLLPQATNRAHTDANCWHGIAKQLVQVHKVDQKQKLAASIPAGQLMC